MQRRRRVPFSKKEKEKMIINMLGCAFTYMKYDQYNDY
jgi:hypothetical protein